MMILQFTKRPVISHFFSTLLGPIYICLFLALTTQLPGYPLSPQPSPLALIMPPSPSAASAFNPPLPPKSSSPSFHFNFSGLSLAWCSLNHSSSENFQFGIRSLPEILLNKSLSSSWQLDLDLSLDAQGSFRTTAKTESSSSARARLYRCWLRLSQHRFEARLGLQKINFGSAVLFRPLMWFDQLDPRDPLQLTRGVYGLLFRYYFPDNTNSWLWVLYGNDDLKGWEILPPATKSFEYGGRLQFPLPKGEGGVSFHHRRVKPFPSALIAGSPPLSPVPENRLGFDGRWDVGVGLWIEASLSHQANDWLLYRWKKSFSLGSDYTFDLGHGLYIVGEYFEFQASRDFFSREDSQRFLGMMMSYPLTLQDSLKVIFFYDLEKNDAYNFLYWQKSLQDWSFFLMIFWNPTDFSVFRKESDSLTLAGKGFQVMGVFYF